MPDMTPEDIEAFLREPNVGVLATIDRDGRPAQTPVWFLWRDGAAVIPTAVHSRKYRNIRRDPRVTFCVDTKTPPYRAAILEGEVEVLDADYREFLRETAVHFLGERAGNRYADASTSTPEDSVLLRLTPSRIIAWAY
jgi:PPOX class probable F420-dependent enzyme